MHAFQPISCDSPLYLETFDDDSSTTSTASPHSPSVIDKKILTHDNFIEKLPHLSTQEVQEFLSLHYKPFFFYVKSQGLENCFDYEQMVLGLESLFWNKPWTVFVFLDLFPNWNCENSVCNFDGCFHRSFLENPFRFRHYLDRLAIAQFISQKSDLEKLYFYTNCKGFWYLFAKESLTPLILLFQKYDEGFSTKSDLVKALRDYFPLVHPRAQKSFFSIDLLVRPFLRLCKNRDTTVLDFFPPEIFASETEKALFAFPFSSEEIQQKIVHDILFQKGEMALSPAAPHPNFEDLSQVPHYLIPHHILQHNLLITARQPLKLIQLDTIETLKRHLVFCIKEAHKSYKKTDIEELKHEWFLSQKGLQKIAGSPDLKSALIEIPFGEFLFVMKYHPELRAIFCEDFGFHRSVCEILSLDEDRLFQHHLEQLESLSKSFSQV
ncbi:MAG: hypothetical protein ACOYL1_01150 [Chlamydiia bacterium]